MRSGTVTEEELLSQPQAWLNLAARMRAQPSDPGIDLGQYEEILAFGSGSSFYLASLLTEAAEDRLGVRARAIPSGELLLFPERHLESASELLSVAISRSGESTEVLRAAEAAQSRGVPVLALTCHADSTLAALADNCISAVEGAERGLVMLRSFTTMLLAFRLLLGSPPETVERLASVASRILREYRAPLAGLAKKTSFDRFVFLGSGLTYPLTKEAGLKIQEAAGATSEAYHPLEYRHGPLATADENTLVTMFAPEEGTLGGAEQRLQYGIDLVRELRAYGCRVLVIAEEPEPYRNHADLTIELASGLPCSERLPLYLLPCQVLALETALRKKRNPDAPRNLNQVVKFK